MGALATAVRIRHDLHSRLLDARARTDEIFRVVREEAMYDRPIPRDTALFSTSDTSRPSIGTCWRSGHLDCGLFSGPSTTCLLLVSTRWTAECLQTQWRIGRHARKSSATTVVCERSWTARSSMRL